MALGLLEAQRDKHADDKEPVQVVRDDGPVGGRVGPAEDGVEDAPAAVGGAAWLAALLGLSATARARYLDEREGVMRREE